MILKEANALIRTARQGAGLSQLDAAKKAGTSQTAWCRIERGQNLYRVQVGTLLSVLDTVGLKFKDIISNGSGDR